MWPNIRERPKNWRDKRENKYSRPGIKEKEKQIIEISPKSKAMNLERIKKKKKNIELKIAIQSLAYSNWIKLEQKKKKNQATN